MNRIIIIGNGFDKAHGLATGYMDFIDSYWTNVSNHIFDSYKRYLVKHWGVLHAPCAYEDEFVFFEVFQDNQHKTAESSSPQSCSSPYEEVRGLVSVFNDSRDTRYKGSVCLTFKNKFFEHISSHCSLTNWVDIENEYYGKLKELLLENDTLLRTERVRTLNQDFDAIKKHLESYLTQVFKEAQIEPSIPIQEAFNSLIDPNEIAYSKLKEVLDSIVYQTKHANFLKAMSFPKTKARIVSHSESSEKSDIDKIQSLLQDNLSKKRFCTPAQTLILNFNYTSIVENFYDREKYEFINIHGQLNNGGNPIIFGYGDELDDDYKRIEKLQDNDFLENIKSVRYHETGNYRQLLGFIESGLYQVITMGHSCGNSDRTLLNTLFEHSNCISVKVYYHQREDGTDDYSQLIRNLSRNFNDKAAMRDKVVNKEYCSPLIPVLEKILHGAHTERDNTNRKRSI